MVNLARHRLPKSQSATGEDRVARKYILSTEAIDMLEELSNYLNRNLSDTLEILIREMHTTLPPDPEDPPVPGFNVDDLET